MNTVQVVVKVVKVGYNVILVKVWSLRRHHIVLVVVPVKYSRHRRQGSIVVTNMGEEVVVQFSKVG